MCYADLGDRCSVGCSGLQRRWAGKPTALPKAPCSSCEERQGAQTRWGCSGGDLKPDQDSTSLSHPSDVIGIYQLMHFSQSQWHFPSPIHRQAGNLTSWGEQKLAPLKAIVAPSPSKSPHVNPHRCQRACLLPEVSKGSCEIHTCTRLLQRGPLRTEKPGHTTPPSHVFANINNFLKVKITNTNPNLGKRGLCDALNTFPESLTAFHGKRSNPCEMNRMPDNFLFLT